MRRASRTARTARDQRHVKSEPTTPVVGRSPAASSRFEPILLGRPHTWAYRGQIIPTNQRATVEAAITHLDDATHTILASGFLIVDGIPIYELTDFGVRCSARSHE